MPRIPLLRGGRPYHSLERAPLADLRSGETVAEVSQANPGLIARDLAGAAAGRRALGELSTAELCAISARAAELFVGGELPLGDDLQSADDYVRQLSATTGLPQSLARANMEKLHFVLSRMKTVLGGLTRGLDPEILDRGWGTEGGRPVSYRRETDLLGAVLPSNSPGVHSLWLPAVALKTALALKPGRQEPWTPFRVAQAFLAAGCPAEAFGFYPTDYAGAGEILLRSGRSLLFGDSATVAPWRSDPRVQIHGPGWSKVVLSGAAAAGWREQLDWIAASVADNGGRSCINASGVWTTADGRALAAGLAERLAGIAARPLEDPEAALAALPSLEAARRLSAHIDARLRIPGAEDLSRRHQPGGRVAAAGGCAFLLPTVIWCSDPEHPLAQAEYLFPFVAVVEAAPNELVRRMGPSLVVSALVDDPELERDLLGATTVERLNLGPIPTSRVSWDQPHEGNLFEHLYRQRAIQGPEIAA